VATAAASGRTTVAWSREASSAGSSGIVHHADAGMEDEKSLVVVSSTERQKSRVADEMVATTSIVATGP
jgi:hypothetical protein